MVIIIEQSIIIPESPDKTSEFAEAYDCSNFFIPAEIIASKEKIAW